MSDELTVAFLDMNIRNAASRGKKECFFYINGIEKSLPSLKPLEMLIVERLKDSDFGVEITSVSGRIPMSEFVAIESAYRDRMRHIGLRSVYRGPRRRDAEFVVLYMKS